MKIKFLAGIIGLCSLFSCASTKRSDVTIIYTTSVQGEYESCGCPKHPLGGISKRAKYVEELKKREKNVIVLDSGDLFFQNNSIPFGSETQWRMKAELIANASSVMGIDAIGLGENDLASGVDFLKETITRSKIKLVTTNVKDSASFSIPFIIIEKNSKKTGVLSVIQPALLKTEDLQLEEIQKAIDEAMKRIRSRVDLVILLSHLTPAEEEKLLKTRSDIDIIISSHYGFAQKPVQINNSIIATAGSRGKYIGVIRISFYGSGPYKLAQEGKKSGSVIYSGEWVPVEQDLPDHEKIDKLIAEYNKNIAEISTQPPVIENISYVSAERCKNCHIKQYNFWTNTKHAHAYKTLERINKNLDPECIGCHTTGFKKPGGFTMPANVGKMKNVQCEACHLNSTEHAKNSGKLKPEKIVPEAICRGCHTHERSPDFNYIKRLPLISCPGGE